MSADLKRARADPAHADEALALQMTALATGYYLLTLSTGILNQDLLDKFNNAELIEGATRVRRGAPIVIKRQMTVIEAHTLRKAVVKHYEEIIGAELAWELTEMSEKKYAML